MSKVILKDIKFEETKAEDRYFEIIHINDCKMDNIYAYNYVNNVYILQYNEHDDLWRFNSVCADDLRSMFEEISLRDSIQEAVEAGLVVHCFFNVVEFGKWLAENAQ